VEQRVVATLSRMAQSPGLVSDGGRIALGASQYRLLCEMVGATRESVSLVLNRLASDGLAERQGGGFVIAPIAELTARVAPTWREGEVSVPLEITSEHRAQM
jgi:hypothetical protein